MDQAIMASSKPLETMTVLLEKAAGLMNESYGCAVLLKGGHSIGDADDLLYEQSNITWFTSVRIDNPNTHGTGCTLSAAIASNLAKGHDLKNSVQLAKTYISGALSAFLDLGSGNGPLHHGYSGRLVHSG
ncbi:MAG: bifunctional hydroxymethylpyrimidine kinase/phosphomethylpyrimidine kinase [Lentisphaeria bacterium]|nr:bifunctional hydroxymethylpyrimidine kinase/phosphomethylpyrimidine kinase [Lentisphaeria bacterium]